MHFILSEKQKEQLLLILQELPAKHSFQAIVMLQQLDSILPDKGIKEETHAGHGHT